MIYFVMPRAQEFGILDYLESWGRNLAGQVAVLHYEDLPGMHSVPVGTYVFTALDQLTPGGKRLVGELQDQLRASPAMRRVLNDPRTALPRLELLTELRRQGLNRHGAIRASDDFWTLRFPVFLREDCRHTGALSPLLRTPAELERAVGRAVLQGYRLEELIVVEFCETVDVHGYYRKYTAYVVGPAVIARGMGRGRHWMLKAEGVEFSAEMLLEERAYALGNPYEEQLRRIFAIARVEYGRIDFALKDGAIETWEINTNPTVGPARHSSMPESWAPMRQVIRDHFSRRFDAALQAMDCPAASALPPLPVSYSPECLRGARPMVLSPRAEGVLVHIARALRPVKPLLNGTARILSPLVAQAARWFR